MQAPLAHIRVLDLSRVLAGPWASQILADLGAEVIKVERPGYGDDTRLWGPPFLKSSTDDTQKDGGYFMAANRGKKSITVDLQTAQGQQIIRQLAAESDIVLENYKVGTLERLGLGYNDLTKVNPKLIYCSVTGFGQTGPRAKQPAYDFLIQAMGGLMSVTGERDDSPGGGPQKVGVPIIDLVTGVYASAAMLAAIVSRYETGEGQYIDLAMLDVQIGLLANQAMNYLISGQNPKRTGTAHPNIQPQRIFKCADADIVIVVGNDGQFRAFCDVIGHPELKTDVRFMTNGQRVINQDILNPILDRELAKKPRSYWLEQLLLANIPAGPINTISEVFEEPQVQHREMLAHYEHPAYGLVPQVLSPFRFNGLPSQNKMPPPMLGEHTESILQSLNYSTDQIQTFKKNNVI
ncbi:CaiB/BaiF CoA transferase family protein [Orrella sp. 11846]|uniref:CaiB/BaiF CoA transferase family protein n=1 Tax=Orrella sp. 11846 TaxID=3409913 RepID=UPI003B595537